jgi:hypothetical protein
MKVKFNAPLPVFPLFFTNLSVSDSFRLQNGSAVYTKVEFAGGLKVRDSRHVDQDYGMLELATGKVFPPSTGQVVRVSVDVSVASAKPY